MDKNMKPKIITALFALTLTMNAMASDATPSPTPNKLNDAMADFVSQMTKTLADTKSFTVAQAPEVLSQYMAYEAWSLQIWMYLILGFALILLALSIWMWMEPDDTGGVALCATVLMFVCIILAMGNYMDIKKIRIAPKVYALEYAKSLVK